MKYFWLTAAGGYALLATLAMFGIIHPKDDLARSLFFTNSFVFYLMYKNSEKQK